MLLILMKSILCQGLYILTQSFSVKSRPTACRLSVWTNGQSILHRLLSSSNIWKTSLRMCYQQVDRKLVGGLHLLSDLSKLQRNSCLAGFQNIILYFEYKPRSLPHLPRKTLACFFVLVWLSSVHAAYGSCFGQCLTYEECMDKSFCAEFLAIEEKLKILCYGTPCLHPSQPI